MHIRSQITLWSNPVGSKKSNGFPSFCLIFFVHFKPNRQSLYRYNPISIPGFLRRWLSKSVSHSHNLFIKWLFGHTLRVLRTSLHIFWIFMDWECSKFPSSGPFLLNNFFPQVISLLLHFTISDKEDPSHTFNTCLEISANQLILWLTISTFYKTLGHNSAKFLANVGQESPLLQSLTAYSSYFPPRLHKNGV